MGYNVANNTGGVEAFRIESGSVVYEGYAYHRGRTSPGYHDRSPVMTWQQYADARAAARNGTVSQWVDAHPAAVKTWLLASFDSTELAALHNIEGRTRPA